MNSLTVLGGGSLAHAASNAVQQSNNVRCLFT